MSVTNAAPAESPTSIEALMVSAMIAAIRAELPAIVRAAVRVEMQRAELPPDVSPARYAQMSGLSQATVRRRISDGTIAARKIGGRVLVSTESLTAVDEIAVARLAMKAVGE